MHLIVQTQTVHVRSPNSFVPNTLIQGNTDYESKSHFNRTDKNEEEKKRGGGILITKSDFQFVHLR